MTPAARALREAQAAGVSIRLDPPASLALGADGEPPASLLQRLRDHKPELLQILRGDRCRWCGEPLDWPRPVGVVEATGTALHHGCYASAEVARLLAAAGQREAPSSNLHYRPDT